MATTKSAPTKVEGRKREIGGILLLAFAAFSFLSLLSMQLGGNRLMGPGGAATAAGLYTVLGMAAYLFVFAAGVVAVRTFRGARIVEGMREAIGAVMLLDAVTVLLHLPFAGREVSMRGPGGLLGQWLGEVTASFIGAAGAALVATTMLTVSLLLVTEIRMAEIVSVLAWAARQARRGLWAGLRAVGRVALAIFPERETADESAENADAAADHDGAAVENDERESLKAAAVPLSPVEAEESEAVHVGSSDKPSINLASSRGEADEADPFSDIIAEVAAVEQPVSAVPQATDAELTTPTVVAAAVEESPARAVEPDSAPIIVQPMVRRPAETEMETAAAEAETTEPKQMPGTFIKLGEGDFEQPKISFLEQPPAQEHQVDEQALYDMAERLRQALANYGVRGVVKEIHMGPVVTMYEFAPAAGTRVNRISALDQDLAMALEAQSVRILAPIPGKAVVGVEVPNKKRETVYLREILEDATFAGTKAKLQIALGKDIKGSPVSVNLAKMPHLLVAGTTGSGKSVAVNGMITSILYNASPDDVRFIMVDPKMLELSIYEGIPHLLLPVVTDPKKANLALRWAVEEMERRYELLSKAGVRDIASYNNKIESAGKKVLIDTSVHPSKKLKVMVAGPDGAEQEVEIDADDDAVVNTDGTVQMTADPEEVSRKLAAAQYARENPEQPPQKLPMIVIVIDEFADLMMAAPKDVETSVARLAQKARAAGLHLILATQRPSVDVITGLIKANFPSRIALQVASKIDSRTILDQTGAEALLGNGDMLFSDRGTKLRRIHGAFLSDDEVHRVVEFLKTQGKPVYDMDILKPREEENAEEGGAPADDFHDELYDRAVAIVCETRQASVSFIQRRLGIGYNRSARMVEQMEREGIVGPSNGIKPREVLAPPGEYLQQAC